MFRSGLTSSAVVTAPSSPTVRTRSTSCAKKGPVTIVYAARDQKHNNAVVVAELVRDG